MSLVLVLAATIALRADPPAMTFAEARAMTPAQLADAVLAPGHPVVVAAEVGRHAPMPPPPPGACGVRTCEPPPQEMQMGNRKFGGDFRVWGVARGPAGKDISGRIGAVLGRESEFA